MDKKIKHLEMIQSIINRMAQNSFIIKGWMLTLIVAMFAFVPRQNVWAFSAIIIVPIITFAILDAYYLMLERKYRIMYNNICRKKEDEIDFNLSINSDCENKSTRFCKCLWSKSIILIYLPILIIAIGIIILFFI